MVEHAAINGVEMRNLVELDAEIPIYSGDLYLDGKEVGTFCEKEEGPMTVDVVAAYRPVLSARAADYLAEVAEEGEDLDREIFYMDLIQLELYRRMFMDGREEGYPVLLVDFGEDQVETYSFESEEEAEAFIAEQGLEHFQLFLDDEDFVISC